MNVKYLVVHCSDSPDDRDTVDAETIHGWHKQNGWSGIGYHAVIKRDGAVEEGRPKYWKGAHVKSLNHCSLGVCLVGRDKFNSDQMSSLRALILKWKRLYPEAKVVGHRDLDSSKTCPNFDVAAWWSTDRAYTPNSKCIQSFTEIR